MQKWGIDMSIFKELQPLVNVSYDDMEAYLSLPERGAAALPYQADQLENLLRENGVTMGIRKDTLQEMIEKKIYDRQVLVAKGQKRKEGRDGYFEFNFRRNIDTRPQIKADGNVDYWNLNLIEVVEEGQVIAIYHPAEQGHEGYNVRGRIQSVPRAREQQPLRGKGFTRSEDNLVYIADISGKLEMQNNCIVISPVHEIYGDVDISTGNVNFPGDVVVHGNVMTGAALRAKGSITIDGVVEGATVEAKGDLVLRGGVKGLGKAKIIVEGSIHARFIERAEIYCSGALDAGVLIDSQIECGEEVRLLGKFGRIIGGQVYALRNIICNQTGNETTRRTELNVGVKKQNLQSLQEIKDALHEGERNLQRVAQVERRLEESRANGEKVDPAKNMQLLRTKIQIEAEQKGRREELAKLNELIQKGSRASVIVFQNVFRGTVVTIDEILCQVKEDTQHVKFRRRLERVILERLEDEEEEEDEKEFV